MTVCKDCKYERKDLKACPQKTDACFESEIALMKKQRDDLLTACEDVCDWLDTSSLQEVIVHSCEDKRIDALIMGIASHLTRLEVAIAQAKEPL